MSSDSGGGSRSDASAGRDSISSLCVCWLGERCFALDTQLVGEVVTVEDKIPVPLAVSAVRGVFNLRGEPVPLVSLAEVLGVAVRDKRASKSNAAIVLRAGELVVGLLADRMEVVLPERQGRLTPPASQEDQTILGFLELSEGELTTVVSVLDAPRVVERLAALGFQKRALA